AAYVGVFLGAPGGEAGGQGTVILAGGTRIGDNTILGCLLSGIATAAEVAAGDLNVSNNIVVSLGYGAAVSTDRTTIADNIFVAVDGADSGDDRAVIRGRRDGIAVMRGDREGVEDVWARGNRIDGFAGAGISVDATILNLLVE